MWDKSLLHTHSSTVTAQTQSTQATAQGKVSPFKYDLDARPSFGALNITFGANILIFTFDRQTEHCSCGK